MVPSCPRILFNRTSKLPKACLERFAASEDMLRLELPSQHARSGRDTWMGNVTVGVRIAPALAGYKRQGCEPASPGICL